MSDGSKRPDNSGLPESPAGGTPTGNEPNTRGVPGHEGETAWDAQGSVLGRLKPALVVLMELEVWPNFLLHAERRNIPVIVANGRMSAQSYRNYRWARPVISPSTLGHRAAWRARCPSSTTIRHISSATV